MGQFYAGGSNLKPFVDPLRTIPNHPNAGGWLYWRAWGNATEKIVGATFTVGIVAPVTIAGAVTTAPVWAPFAWQGVRYLGTRTLQGLRAYNNTFGKNGGYINMLVDGGLQNLANNGNFNYYSFIGSGFFPGNSAGKIAVFEISTNVISVNTKDGLKISKLTSGGVFDFATSKMWGAFGLLYGSPAEGLLIDGVTKAGTGLVREKDNNE